MAYPARVAEVVRLRTFSPRPNSREFGYGPALPTRSTACSAFAERGTIRSPDAGRFGRSRPRSGERGYDSVSRTSRHMLTNPG